MFKTVVSLMPISNGKTDSITYTDAGVGINVGINVGTKRKDKILAVVMVESQNRNYRNYLLLLKGQLKEILLL